jgi:glycosyltransferase involved in cell wall biosynthesis
MIHLSLVLPIYNEESCLEKSFETIKGYLDTLPENYEIILVDDGSTDSTASIIKQIVQTSPQSRSIVSHKNQGKGDAVKRGVLDAGGKYIIFTDTDLAVPVHFIGTCLKQLETGAPVVIGSRHLPESSFKVRESFLRQFLGEIFRRFAKLSLGLRVSDITCGLKGLEKSAALDILSRSKIERWGYDAEIIFLAQKLGFAIEEVPVDWYHSFDSKVRVGIDSLRTFEETCRVYYYYLTKQYNLN